MKKVVFTAIGTKPLLYHKFNIEVLSNKTKTKSGTTGNDPEEWKTTVHVDGKRLFFPHDYWLSCIKDGGKYVKQGRGTISNKLAGCMSILSERTYLNIELPDLIDKLETSDMPRDPTKSIFLDVRGVKNPATKGKNVRYRLGVKAGWQTQVELEFDDTVLSKDDIRKALEAAGKFSGIGDGRSIGYGRFEVVDVEFS